MLPVPIFINGVEAHTVVRDLLTSSYEQGRRAEGILDVDTLSPDCAEVRVLISKVPPRVWGEGKRSWSCFVLAAKTVAIAPLLKYCCTPSYEVE